MTVSEDEPAEAIMHEIAEKMRKIDRGRGVIIITDQSIIPKHSSLISKHFSGKYTIVEDMTIQKIVSIAEHVESLGATIQSSDAFDSLTTEQVTAETSVPCSVEHFAGSVHSVFGRPVDQIHFSYIVCFGTLYKKRAVRLSKSTYTDQTACDTIQCIGEKF